MRVLFKRFCLLFFHLSESSLHFLGHFFHTFKYFYTTVRFKHLFRNASSHTFLKHSLHTNTSSKVEVISNMCSEHFYTPFKTLSSHTWEKFLQLLVTIWNTFLHFSNTSFTFSQERSYTLFKRFFTPLDSLHTFSRYFTHLRTFIRISKQFFTL